MRLSKVIAKASKKLLRQLLEPMPLKLRKVPSPLFLCETAIGFPRMNAWNPVRVLRIMELRRTHPRMRLSKVIAKAWKKLLRRLL